MSPVYDIVCSAHYYPDAPELAIELIPGYEGSLAAEGYYTKRDFLEFGLKTGLTEKQAAGIINELTSFESIIYSQIERSFIPEDKRPKIKAIIEAKYNKFRAN